MVARGSPGTHPGPAPTVGTVQEAVEADVVDGQIQIWAIADEPNVVTVSGKDTSRTYC